MQVSYLNRDQARLVAQPWKVETAIPPEVLAAKGSLGPEERRLCYWLGRNWLSGRGCVVDVGAYLGSASLSFAAGAADAGLGGQQGRPLIHAFDQFRVQDRYVAEAISRDVRPIKYGESFLDIFRKQVADHAGLIETHEGNLLQQRWSGEPIEVLFVDSVTSRDINSHVVRQFFPSLIPGRAVVVYKAYYHCWHPYIQVGMAYFGDAFELIDGFVPYQGRVWRLARPLSGEKIARMAAYSIDKEERLALLAELIANAEEPSRAMLELTRIWQLALDDDKPRARAELQRVRDSYRYQNRDELWARQAQDIERQITDGGWQR